MGFMVCTNGMIFGMFLDWSRKSKKKKKKFPSSLNGII